MADEVKSDKSAQKRLAEQVEAANAEKEERRMKAESGPVSVMEHIQANPNPPDLHKDTPRPKAQAEAGMDDNTLQEDVGLRDPKTGLQPKEAGEVENAAAISTHQHIMAPQGDANAPEDSKGSKAKGKK